MTRDGENGSKGQACATCGGNAVHCCPDWVGMCTICGASTRYCCPEPDCYEPFVMLCEMDSCFDAHALKYHSNPAPEDQA